MGHYLNVYDKLCRARPEDFAFHYSQENATMPEIPLLKHEHHYISIISFLTLLHLKAKQQQNPNLTSRFLLFHTYATNQLPLVQTTHTAIYFTVQHTH